MGKHLSVEALMSIIIDLADDLKVARELVYEAPGLGVEYKIACKMRDEVFESRRKVLDEINKKGGYEKYWYAAHVLCPI